MRASEELLLRVGLLALIMLGMTTLGAAQFSPSDAGTEEWSYNYGDTVQSVAVEDGDVYAGGYADDVVKLDSNGNEEWSYNYGDTVQSVAVEDGEVYAGGSPDGEQVVKLDSSGNEEWSYDYGDSVWGVAVEDGEVYAGGNADEVVKLDSSGSEEWSYNYGDTVYRVTVEDGNVYAGGYADEVVKLDSNGNEEWSYDYGNNVYRVTVEDGNVYAGGNADEVVKLDSSGNEEWSYDYGDTVYGVSVDGDGNVYAGGNADEVVKLDSSGNEEWSYDYGDTVQSVSVDGDGNVYAGGYADEVVKLTFNQPPEFNSTTISPDPPLIGESVSYDAEVFDPDGSIDYTNLTVEFDGSTVVSDDQETGETPSWGDVYTPDSEGWLNATFTAVDDEGAETSEELNRYLSDDAPTIDLQEPENTTYWSYDVPIEFEVSDSDSVPEEDWSCEIEKDGELYETVYLKEGTNSTYSDVVSSDLGSHQVDVTCSDPENNTGNVSEDYTVKAFEVVDNYSPSSVLETEAVDYDFGLEYGEMVESVDYNLVWDGDTVNESDSFDVSGHDSLYDSLGFEIPLVEEDGVEKDWFFEYDIEYKDFDGDTVNESGNTSVNNQTVDHSIALQDSFTEPGDGDVIEGGDIDHRVNLSNELGKASISGTSTYLRDDSTTSMEKEDEEDGSEVWKGVLDAGRADDFNESSFDVESTIDLEFQGSERSIDAGPETFNVHKIRLTDGSSDLQTAEALEFNTGREASVDEPVDTDLFLDLTLRKNGIERSYSFISENKSTHSFNIYPEWAEFEAYTRIGTDNDDLIQYEQSESELEDGEPSRLRSYFFPEPQSETLSSDLTSIPLKTIPFEDSETIDIEMTGSSGNPASNVVCRADRKLPGQGTFETSFMWKTGSEGRSQSFAEVNEIYYKYVCFESDGTEHSFSEQIMQSPLRLKLGDDTESTLLDFGKEFDAEIVSENESYVEFDYQSSSEGLTEAVLEVDEKGVVSNENVCTRSSTTMTGSLSCSGLNTTENSYEYELRGIYGDTYSLGDSGVLGDDDGSSFGATGLLVSMIMFAVIFGASARNVVLGAGTGTAWLLASEAIGFYVMTPEVRASLISLVIVIAWVVSR